MSGLFLIFRPLRAYLHPSSARAVARFESLYLLIASFSVHCNWRFVGEFGGHTPHLFLKGSANALLRCHQRCPLSRTSRCHHCLQSFAEILLSCQPCHRWKENILISRNNSQIYWLLCFHLKCRSFGSSACSLLHFSFAEKFSLSSASSSSLTIANNCWKQQPPRQNTSPKNVVIYYIKINKFLKQIKW